MYCLANVQAVRSTFWNAHNLQVYSVMLNDLPFPPTGNGEVVWSNWQIVINVTDVIDVTNVIDVIDVIDVIYEIDRIDLIYTWSHKL